MQGGIMDDVGPWNDSAAFSRVGLAESDLRQAIIPRPPQPIAAPYLATTPTAPAHAASTTTSSPATAAAEPEPAQPGSQPSASSSSAAPGAAALAFASSSKQVLETHRLLGPSASVLGPLPALHGPGAGGERGGEGCAGLSAGLLPAGAAHKTLAARVREAESLLERCRATAGVGAAVATASTHIPSTMHVWASTLTIANGGVTPSALSGGGGVSTAGVSGRGGSMHVSGVRSMVTAPEGSMLNRIEVRGGSSRACCWHRA